MADEETETRDNGLDPWSHHGPDAGRLVAADEFQYLMVLGWSAATSLELDDRLRELVNLHSEALTSGVSDTHLLRLRSIIARIAASAQGLEGPGPRGRGRPRQLEPSETDRRILKDIRRLRLELLGDAAIRGEEPNLGRIDRAALGGAIHAAEIRGDLNQDVYQRADKVRINRWRKREIEQLKQLLAAALAGAPRSQNGT
jgi:hypothetical protein